MTTFGERLKELAKRLGKEDQDVANDLGLSKAQMSHYTTGKRKVPSELLQKIVSIYKINPQFLFQENASLYLDANQNMLVREESAPYITSPHQYDYYPIAIAAGLPSNVESVMEEDIRKITVPDSFMGKWAGKKDIYLTKVNGDSMNRLITSGSMIAVKRIDLANLKNDDIVVFSDGNEFSVKRFYNDVEGKRFVFRPDSNDRRFLDYTVAYENAKNLRIHGKVVVYIVALD